MKAAEIDRVFHKLGMEIREAKDRLAWFVHEGKRILMTKRSHGRGELKGRTAHLIRQQLRLNEEQFRQVVACPLDRQGYIEILRQKGLLPPT